MPSIIGTDSESLLIQKGQLAPPPVCFSTAQRLDDGSFKKQLFLRDEGVQWVKKQLADCDSILAIHNAPFDIGVACQHDHTLLPLVFAGYRAHRIRCTIVRQKLIDIALGMRKFRRQQIDGRVVVAPSRYDLSTLIAHYYNEHLEKKDTWRLSYGLLDNVPLHLWPPPAAEYAIKDAVEHTRLYEAQERLIQATWGELPNQAAQQCASIALHFMGAWGLRADSVAVDKFIAHCENEIAKMHRDLEGTNIFKPDGSRTMAEIRRRVIESCGRLSVQVPMTDPSKRFPQGQVQTDKEALEATDDTNLHILASQMTFAKHLAQWGPTCRAAVLRPVCAKYDPLMETGRTACSGGGKKGGQEGTNFQNPPRKGDVRPCFIPRPGFLYAFTDADTIELRSHAQNCLELVGWSKMAEALIDQFHNGGPDLHLRLAAAVLGITNAEAMRLKQNGDLEIALARQFVKIPNFGFPGGLGAETMITYAAGQLDKADHQKWFGVTREEQLSKARRLREVWLDTWPENHQYFKIIGNMVGRGGQGVIRQLMSGRIRGGMYFTNAANGFFQGRVADAMKEILFNLAEECYTGRCTSNHTHGGSSVCTIYGRTILYGSRPVLFLHDEPILEHPENGSESDRAERQRQIVVEGLSRWMPDIPCTSSAVLCRRWYKGAEPIKVDGKLVAVKPEKFTGVDGKEKVRWVEDKRNAPTLGRSDHPLEQCA